MASERIHLENQDATDGVYVISLLIYIHCNSTRKKEVVKNLIK